MTAIQRSPRAASSAAAETGPGRSTCTVFPSSVATVAIGRAGAENAAILAAQILATRDAAIAQRLERFKAELAEGVKQKNLRLQKKVDPGHAG